MQRLPDTALALAKPLGDRADREFLSEIQPDRFIDFVRRHGLLPHCDAVIGEELQHATLRDAKPAAEAVR